MLLLFRLYHRHVVGCRTDNALKADLSTFEDAVIHCSESETCRFRIYDLEITATSIKSDQLKVNTNTAVSPMNIEFAVFVGKTSGSKNVSFCWFSLIELWNFLYNKTGINKIQVDERMAGHFIRWQTILARVNIEKEDAKKAMIFSRKSTAKNRHCAYAPYSINMDTIFVSGLGLWHFIFSSPYAERALFLAHILKKYVYPTVENTMSLRVVHFSEMPPDSQYYYKPSRLGSVHAWFTSCLHPMREQRIIRSYPLLASQSQSLKNPWHILENPIIEMKEKGKSSHRYQPLNQDTSEVNHEEEVSPLLTGHPNTPDSTSDPMPLETTV